MTLLNLKKVKKIHVLTRGGVGDGLSVIARLYRFKEEMVPNAKTALYVLPGSTNKSIYELLETAVDELYRDYTGALRISADEIYFDWTNEHTPSRDGFRLPLPYYHPLKNTDCLNRDVDVVIHPISVEGNAHGGEHNRSRTLSGDSWNELLVHLLDSGFNIVRIGTGNDKRELQIDAPIEDLTDKLTLRQAMDICYHSSVVLGTNSWPVFTAAYAGIPSFIFSIALSFTLPLYLPIKDQAERNLWSHVHIFENNPNVDKLVEKVVKGIKEGKRIRKLRSPHKMVPLL